MLKKAAPTAVAAAPFRKSLRFKIFFPMVVLLSLNEKALSRVLRCPGLFDHYTLSERLTTSVFICCPSPERDGRHGY